jgi:predicted metal-dependent phosphoesterase TrpH
MSFSDIVSKLAEQKALEGDSDFAFRLISASDKMTEEKEEKEAEMIKRGKDREKLASKELWIEAYQELVVELAEKFMQKGLEESEAENAAEKYLENNYRLVDERAADKEAHAIDFARDSYNDLYASTLSNMIKKYAGGGKDKKKVANKDSWSYAYEELLIGLIEEFMQKGLEVDAAEKAAEKYLEQNWNLIDERVADNAGMAIDDAMDMHDDAYASTLSNMIKKYAGGGKDEKGKTSQELEVERHKKNEDKLKNRKDRWDKFKSENYKKSSVLDSMIKKYAKEDWEVTGEEFYEPMANENSIPLDAPGEFIEECSWVDTPVGGMLVIEVPSSTFAEGTRFRCMEIV